MTNHLLLEGKTEYPGDPAPNTKSLATFSYSIYNLDGGNAASIHIHISVDFDHQNVPSKKTNEM